MNFKKFNEVIDKILSEYIDVSDVAVELSNQLEAYEIGYNGYDYVAKSIIQNDNLKEDVVKLEKILSENKIDVLSGLIGENSTIIEGYFGNLSYAVVLKPLELETKVPKNMDLEHIKKLVLAVNEYILHKKSLKYSK
ncbi:MAG: hypothetical protein AB7V77_03410 [Candidatus Woesearchaeota archaeon]